MEAVLNTNPYISMVFVILYLVVTLIFVKMIKKHSKTNNINTFKGEMNHIKKEKVAKAEKEGIYLGLSGKKKIYMKENAKNIYVCGTTGAGKTVTLSNFIKYGVDNDIPLLIVDGKGDTNEDSILDIITKLKGNKKLYVIDLNNPERSNKYNPFINTSYTVVKDMLINMELRCLVGVKYS